LARLNTFAVVMDSRSLSSPFARTFSSSSGTGNMGNVVLDQHPLKEQIMAWQRIADQAKKKT